MAAEEAIREVRRRLLVIALAGCGRIAFDPLGDAGPTIVANRAFVTSNMFTGNLGGLVGADAACAAAASAAGLPGTFLAMVSTPSTNAADQFAGATSSGWVRLDGAPLFNYVQIALAFGEMYNVLDIDEHGHLVGPAPGVFTGTGPGGNDSFDCLGWTDGSSSQFGEAGDPTAGGADFVQELTFATCDQPRHLYCLEIGHTTMVSPAGPANGRRVFVQLGVAAVGPAGADLQCQADAAAAGLTGTYVAAIATTTATIASRFTADSRPIVRIDGTLVAGDITQLMTPGLDLRSFVNQRASGLRTLSTVLMWTGAVDPQTLGTPATTCNDWSSTATTDTGEAGDPWSATAGRFWASTALSCSSGAGALCIEQ